MQFFSLTGRTSPIQAIATLFTVLIMLFLAACGDTTAGGGTGSGGSGRVVNLTFWSWVPNLNTSVYTSGGQQQYVYSLIVTGALISVLPLIIGFLCLQRYWRSGLTLGSIVS